MNYQERKNAAAQFSNDTITKYGVAVFEQAKVMLMTHGQTQCTSASWAETTKQHLCRKDDAGAIVSNDYMLRIIDCAAEIAAWASAPNRATWELQVLCYPESAIDNNDGSTCPICDADLEFCGDQEIVDDGTTVSWVCPECGATGVQGNVLVFERHYNVKDRDGNDVG